MDAATRERPVEDGIACRIVPPTRAVPDIIEDVLQGLLTPPRSLPPKYFYDEHGSRLFDRICATPEYYLTRTEDALLARVAGDIVATVRPAEILELGSGTSEKTRRLLDACAALRVRARYLPFDVCEEMLVEASRGLQADYDWITVTPLLGDYHAGLEHLPPGQGARLFVFLGSTIGNFEGPEAGAFLGELAASMGRDDWLLLGADRVKDPRVLEAAYNDAAGITAAFNLNVLRVLNRRVGADFALDAFRHRATWNERQRQMEMQLLSTRAQTVRLRHLERSLELGAGETIRTEVSRKFTPEDLEGLFGTAGLRIVSHYQADDGYYSLLLGRPA